MTQKPIDVRVSGPNALWVENKGYDVGPLGDAGIGDLVDDTHSQGLGSIFGSGFSEQLPRSTFVDVRSIDDNVGNANLVRQYPVK